MIKSMNIAWWVQRWSELHPQKTAIRFEEESISYLELHRKVDRTAFWLQDLGIEKGDRVAVMLKNCPEFLEIYIASARIGAIFVPVNFRLAEPELDYILKNARPRLFVFGADQAPLVEKLSLNASRPPLLQSCVGCRTLKASCFDYHTEVMSFEGKPFLTQYPSHLDPLEPQVIMYTSGTTGYPKGAVLTHRKTFFNCLNAEIFFKLHFDDVMLIFLPLFHSGGLFIQASPAIFKGATIVLHPRFDPIRIYRDIGRYRVTKFLGVPTTYKSLLDVDKGYKGDISSLHVCAIGGEMTTPELLSRFRDAGFRLRQIMGQTETSILLWASEDDFLTRPGTVGRPVFHAEVGLADKEGRPVPVGEVGEIVVAGSILMREYWMDPQRTAETLKNGRLHTGDLARMDEDGYFYLVDRVGDMYISGGENVYPAEVERVIESHPDIREAAVAGVPDDTWGEVGHAFLICKNGIQPSFLELVDFCKKHLAAFKIPKNFTFCDDFPRTALGKVRKHMLISQSMIH